MTLHVSIITTLHQKPFLILGPHELENSKSYLCCVSLSSHRGTCEARRTRSIIRPNACGTYDTVECVNQPAHCTTRAYGKTHRQERHHTSTILQSKDDH